MAKLPYDGGVRSRTKLRALVNIEGRDDDRLCQENLAWPHIGKAGVLDLGQSVCYFSLKCLPLYVTS